MAPLQSTFDSANSDDTLQESNHRKRHKIGDHNDSLTTTIPWRSYTEQRIYSSKLVKALRHVLRRSSPPERTKPSSGHEVRDAADRVLAATARGRTRWSRAILASRLSRRRLQLKMRHMKAKKAATGMVKRLPETPRRLPVVQKKARVLGRLVPGCRKVPFPNLLEEATDYIAALQMQVRAMTALAELLGGGATPENQLGLTRP